MSGGSAHPQIPAGSFAWRVTCYREFGWSASQVDEIMQRGWEADRLAVYFEEVGAYEYQQSRKYSSSSSPTEVTERVFEDQEAEVYIPDDDFIEE